MAVRGKLNILLYNWLVVVEDRNEKIKPGQVKLPGFLNR